MFRAATNRCLSLVLVVDDDDDGDDDDDDDAGPARPYWNKTTISYAILAHARHFPNGKCRAVPWRASQ
jgi:hypothetical protein